MEREIRPKLIADAIEAEEQGYSIRSLLSRRESSILRRTLSRREVVKNKKNEIDAEFDGVRSPPLLLGC